MPTRDFYSLSKKPEGVDAIISGQNIEFQSIHGCQGEDGVAALVTIATIAMRAAAVAASYQVDAEYGTLQHSHSLTG